MARVVVLGAGVCGLAAGLVLARDGHEVRVLERDADPVPDSPDAAWAGWPRRGVAQFRQAHLLQARGAAVLEEALPDVAAALHAARATRFDPLVRLPPAIADRAPRPGDARFVTVATRRTTFEHVLARAAEAQPGLEVRRGAAVRELLARPVDGVPHVRGVRTEAGEVVEADLVVDATGRRSDLPERLRRAGARPVEDRAGDGGFVYFTRFLRARDGTVPQLRTGPNSPVGSFSLLVLPADDARWSITVYGSMRDRALKRLRDPARFDVVVGACPLHAHLLDGEPVSGVLAMSGTVGRLRRLVAGGRPVATGVVALGDAWACTNPSIGRGMTLGLLHVQRLRAVLRAHGDHPGELAEAWDADTQAELRPWYDETVAEDRTRLAEMEALRLGRAAPPPATPADVLRTALFAAAPHDAGAFRALLESRCCLTRFDELLARPGLAERLAEVAAAVEPRPVPGPSRRELLELLA